MLFLEGLTRIDKVMSRFSDRSHNNLRLRGRCGVKGRTDAVRIIIDLIIKFTLLDPF